MKSLAALTALFLTACGASLPEGWENAERLAVTQSDCMEDPTTAEERLEYSIEAGVASFQYAAANFRCEQTVEAFARKSDGKIDLLFQPEDLNPWSVTKCDCRYNFDGKITLKETTTLSVWRRGDSVGGEMAPQKITEASLSLD